MLISFPFLNNSSILKRPGFDRAISFRDMHLKTNSRALNDSKEYFKIDNSYHFSETFNPNKTVLKRLMNPGYKLNDE